MKTANKVIIGNKYFPIQYVNVDTGELILGFDKKNNFYKLVNTEQVEIYNERTMKMEIFTTRFIQIKATQLNLF